jgi:hypothetical protein
MPPKRAITRSADQTPPARGKKGLDEGDKALISLAAILTGSAGGGAFWRAFYPESFKSMTQSLRTMRKDGAALRQEVGRAKRQLAGKAVWEEELHDAIIGPSEGGEGDVVRVLPDQAYITKIEGNGIYYYDLDRPHAGEKVHRLNAEVPADVAATMTMGFKQNAEHILTGRTAKTLALGNDLTEEQITRIIAKELSASSTKAKFRELAATIKNGNKTERERAVQDMVTRIRASYTRLGADPELGPKIAVHLSSMRLGGGDSAVARMVRATWGGDLTPTQVGRGGSEVSHRSLANAVLAVLNEEHEPSVEERFALLMHNDLELFAHLHA